MYKYKCRVRIYLIDETFVTVYGKISIFTNSVKDIEHKIKSKISNSKYKEKYKSHDILSIKDITND